MGISYMDDWGVLEADELELGTRVADSLRAEYKGSWHVIRWRVLAATGKRQ